MNYEIYKWNILSAIDLCKKEYGLSKDMDPEKLIESMDDDTKIIISYLYQKIESLYNESLD